MATVHLLLAMALSTGVARAFLLPHAQLFSSCGLGTVGRGLGGLGSPLPSVMNSKILDTRMQMLPRSSMDWGAEVKGLRGRVCLVTGASQGIGKGIAIALGEQGATVYFTGRSMERLKDTSAEIEKRGGKPVPLEVDHAEQAQIEALFAKIREDEGKLDILVNNCYAAVDGIFNKTTRGQKFWERDLSWFDRVNNVGLKAHFTASQLAVPLMLPHSTRAKPGLIVHISSFGGLIYLFDVAYGVGKGKASSVLLHSCSVARAQCQLCALHTHLPEKARVTRFSFLFLAGLLPLTVPPAPALHQRP